MKYHENISVFYKKQPCFNPQMRLGKKNHWNFCGSGSEWGTQPLMKSVENRNGNMKFPNSVLYFNSPNRNGVLHPTQKPVALLEYLINTYSNEGELVLDNTAGSMSTAIAAINTKRKCICIEKDDEYFKIGSERVEKRLKEIKEDLFNE